jgi:general secretion pathway protein G
MRKRNRYQELVDRNLIRVRVGGEGYPLNLETIVNGARMGVGDDDKVRFLCRIPVDPRTGRPDAWGRRSGLTSTGRIVFTCI